MIASKIVVGAWTAGLCALACAEPTSIKLRGQAAVSATSYTLSDIAEIGASDPEQRDRLGALAIGKTPRAGYVESVDRDRIQRVLKRSAPGIRRQVRWEGPDTVQVTALKQTIDAGAITRAAAVELFSTFGRSYRPLEVRPVGHLDNVTVPAGNVRLVARLMSNPTLAKRTCVLVDILIEGVDYNTIPVWLAVKAVQPVLAAKTSLRPGQALRREDFTIRSTDITALGSAPIAVEDDLQALRLRQAIAPEDALLRSNVEIRPAVTRDQTVQVRIMGSAIAVETTGLATTDARLGEMVKIKNPASAQLYAATVVGDGLVEVHSR